MEAHPSSTAKPTAGGVALLEEIPVIDLSLYLTKDSDKTKLQAEAEKVAFCLHNYGILVVKDPRVSEEDNNRFLDLLERYFEQPTETKMPDARPDYHYQVGVTPDHVERPRDHCSRMDTLPEGARPLSLCPPELDPKWRYFWRIGSRPTVTKFTELNAAPVIPAAFPEWKGTMDSWGNKMLAALVSTAGLAAIGMGLPENTFMDMMNNGPHLLAPTGSDFNKYGAEGTVLAGYHYDLNFLTIHGKSRFPGLYIWLRDGRKILVKVPDQCLLVQAGKQFEYLTAGHVLAGFHEVVVDASTVKRIDERRAAGKSLWRISSTLFGHIASDQSLKPVGKFSSFENASSFPDVFAGDQVQEELKAISLAKSAH